MSDFKSEVYHIVSRIPEGKVMSYGQIAALCGHPRAARTVGQIAHFGDEHLPWHRVVNAKGGLAKGYWGGKKAHASALEAEGVKVKNYSVNMRVYRWWPDA